MFDVTCRAPGCEGALPEYPGRGRPRKWCSAECRRTAEIMLNHYRRGTLGELADESRLFGFTQNGARLDEWKSLFDGFGKVRR